MWQAHALGNFNFNAVDINIFKLAEKKKPQLNSLKLVKFENITAKIRKSVIIIEHIELLCNGKLNIIFVLVRRRPLEL